MADGSWVRSPPAAFTFTQGKIMQYEPILKPGRANVVIDGQWGSTGKGKLAGYLCRTERVDCVVCDYMPNAGHTYIDPDGKEFIVRQIPVGACFPEIESIILGPHSAIDVDIFLSEVDMIEDPNRIKIHPLATVVSPDDCQWESKAAGRIANTAKGGHASYMRKALRSTDAMLAKDNEILKPWVSDMAWEEPVNIMRHGGVVLLETAQGFDLGLNHGTSYPYVTGRDCLVGRAMDNAGIPPRYVGSVVASLRTYPIRVGNTPTGYSGDVYPGQRELNWSQISNAAGYSVEEMTTVTKRVRRVFEFSFEQMHRMCRHLGPTHAFLNFVNYIRNPIDRDLFIGNLYDVLDRYDCELSLLGTGARCDEMRRIGARHEI